jgi:hypothetical protein
MMRYALMAGALVLVAGPALADDCKPGALELTGVMGEPVAQKGGWTMVPMDETKPCEISSAQGKGRVPGSCKFGARFSASGTVEDNLGFMEFKVKSIKCTP